MRYKWRLRNSRPFISKEKLDTWASELGVSPKLVKLMMLRGINTKDRMEFFISPLIRYLPPINSWRDLIAGAEFLVREIDRKAQIGIWGDYDVDGICSVAILGHFLKQVGCRVHTYIPNRLYEGYGLNPQGIRDFSKLGVDIVITVDCGISNIEEVKLAKDLGMKVMITDHHLPKDNLPKTDIILNPKLDSSCPYPNLAGVGVSFLLVAATNRLLSKPIDIKQYLDLVALGTLADVVELTMENRILVKNGLLFLNEAKRPGIFALKEVAGLSPYAEVGTYEVCFMLAPRINSAGRMDDPKIALDLLMTDDLKKAREIAKVLNSLNAERQKEEDKILKEALKQIIQEGDKPAFVLFSSKWHQGIIGIVASRLVEQFYRPVILIAGEDKEIKGSGRSIPELHLFNALYECKDCLKSFGGHAQAAGLSLNQEDIEIFKNRFLEIVETSLKEKDLTPTLVVDERLSFEEININFLRELDILQPFGPGNPKPLFYSYPLKVQKFKKIGDDHIALEVRENKGQRTLWAKFWRKARYISEDVVGKDIIAVFTPKLNLFNNLLGMEIEVLDWRILDT